jgi:hypothetical protein
MNMNVHVPQYLYFVGCLRSTTAVALVVVVGGSGREQGSSVWYQYVTYETSL